MLRRQAHRRRNVNTSWPIRLIAPIRAGMPVIHGRRLCLRDFAWQAIESTYCSSIGGMYLQLTPSLLRDLILYAHFTD